MDKKAIKSEIDSLIQRIKERSGIILDNDKIPDSDMTAFLSDVDKLHEHVAILNYLNLNMIENSVSEKQVIETPPTSVETVEIKESPVNLVNSDAPIVVEKSNLEKAIPKKEEKISSSKIQKPKIENLNNAIGLNDKFQFANELFAGSMKEYNVAIHQLNISGTIQSAMDYIENLKQLYDWDFENETVKRLLDLVDRRYSS